MPHCVQALRLVGGARKGLADLPYVKSCLACINEGMLGFGKGSANFAFVIWRSRL